jgi:hypothetical protein
MNRHPDSTRLGALEPVICDCSDMAEVAIILLEHHRAETQATKTMDITGKQAIDGLNQSLDALDCVVRHLATYAKNLHRQYYAEEDAA